MPDRMQFVRFGKTFQLRLETARDLAHVLELDQALWVATSAPVQAFRCDPRLTEFLDEAGKGRINTEDVRTAVRWLLERLAADAPLTECATYIRLEWVRDTDDAGLRIAEAAAYVLQALDAADRDAITLEQVRGFLAELRQRPLNGDGVLVPDAADDAGLRQYIRDVCNCVGGRDDASGKAGVTPDRLTAFREAATDYLAWKQRGEADATAPALASLGQTTSQAYAVFSRHAAAVDLFFELCRALRFEPCVGARLRVQAAALSDYDFRSAADLGRCLAEAPIARPGPESLLPLAGDGVNPFYRDWAAALRDAVLEPILGEPVDTLTEADWERVKQTLAPYGAYQAGKAGACVEQLAEETLKGYLAGDFETRALALIEADMEVARMRDGAQSLERLILFHAQLLPFVNNFVSFSHLYDLNRPALFEMGSAVIDGRWFNLAVRVDDLAAHSALARSSNLFMLYLEVAGTRPEDCYTVAVPATSGAKGNLCVGKRGVFFDTDGREHSARIVQIIQNPISVREALGAPFMRLWQFLVGKIEAMSGASEQELQKKADALLKQGGTHPAGTGAPAPAEGAARPASLLVGLSLSAAAVGSAFAFITKTFTGMSRYQLLAGVLGAGLVVMVPVTLLAILKLRRQDLSALLEGCGWAINARMRLTRSQRRQFTRRPGYPSQSLGIPRQPWLPAAVCVVAAAVILALLYLLLAASCGG